MSYSSFCFTLSRTILKLRYKRSSYRRTGLKKVGLYTRKMTDRGRQRDKYKEKRGDTKILKQIKRINTLVLWKIQIVLGKMCCIKIYMLHWRSFLPQVTVAIIKWHRKVSLQKVATLKESNMSVSQLYTSMKSDVSILFSTAPNVTQ